MKLKVGRLLPVRFPVTCAKAAIRPNSEALK